jgi:Fe-S oxidoreductase
MLSEGTWREISRCISCGACNEGCSLFHASERKESLGPRSRINIVRAINTKAAQLSINSIEHLYLCGSCTVCNKYCPLNIDIAGLMIRIREELIRAGYVPPYNIARMRRNIEVNDHPWDSWDKGKWIQVRRSARPKKHLFFAGCWTTRSQDMANSAYMVAKKVVKDDLGLLESAEPCCGYPLKIAGHVDAYKEVLMRARSKIEGFEDIVTPCISCKESFKESGLSSHYLLEMVPEDLEAIKRRSGKAALIGSCRDSFTDKARNILKIAGYDVVDLPDWCCMDCGFSLAYTISQDLMKSVASKIMETASDLGADMLVIVDPFSYYLFSSIEGGKIEIRDIYSILLDSFRL